MRLSERIENARLKVAHQSRGDPTVTRFALELAREWVKEVDKKERKLSRKSSSVWAERNEGKIAAPESRVVREREREREGETYLNFDVAPRAIPRKRKSDRSQGRQVASVNSCPVEDDDDDDDSRIDIYISISDRGWHRARETH